MSLSLPNNYKRSNINENWLFQIFNSRDSFLSFDGSNDFIDYGTTDSTITALTSNITIAFYVKFPTASIGSSTYIFGQVLMYIKTKMTKCLYLLAMERQILIM